MMEELKVKQPQFYFQIVQTLSNVHLLHAYIIETNNNLPALVESYVRLFVTQILLSKTDQIPYSFSKLNALLEKNTYPDVVEIRAQGNVIKKESILEIKEKFRDASVYQNYQIYVIYDADKMNTSAANTILKFLEEPENDIIAILVTNNRYKIMDTILSRCSVLTLKQEPQMVQIEENSPIMLDLIEKIINQREKLIISFQNYYEGLFKTREMADESVGKLIVIFKTFFQSSLSEDEKYSQYTEKLEITTLLEIIFIIEQAQQKLKYNVNLKLWLDELLLHLTEEIECSY